MKRPKLGTWEDDYWWMTRAADAEYAAGKGPLAAAEKANEICATRLTGGPDGIAAHP